MATKSEYLEIDETVVLKCAASGVCFFARTTTPEEAVPLVPGVHLEFTDLPEPIRAAFGMGAYPRAHFYLAGDKGLKLWVGHGRRSRHICVEDMPVGITARVLHNGDAGMRALNAQQRCFPLDAATTSPIRA